MQVEEAIVIGGIAALMAVLGFVLGRKAGVDLNRDLVQTKNDAEKDLAGCKQNLHETEIDLSRHQTLLSERSARIETLNAELKVSNVDAASALQERHSAEKSNESAQTALREQVKQYVALESRFLVVEEGLVLERQNHQSAKLAHGELKVEIEEQSKNFAEQKALFSEQKSALSEQFGEKFQVLANEILETKTKALQESSKLSLSSIMNPFQQSIDGFKKEVQDIHHRETRQRSELKTELEQLKLLNQKITTEAHELSTALRGQKKLQGNWGELVLENVLDRSGLQLGKDYKREVSFTTEDGRKRPDAVVYLPQDKHLVIDAKVSLNAYTRFINSEDEDVRKLALDEHVKAMGDRIKELADRDYYKLPGLNSPEMVFMFVPIESAFVEALKADEGLFQAAIENNVLVATPTTLLTSLNIVRQLWRYEDQNKHTVALAQKAELVFKKLNSFLMSFENIRKGLDKANEAYSSAEGQLLSGRGNLVKQVGEFKNLAPAIKAELPSYFKEKSDLEIDFIAPVDEELPAVKMQIIDDTQPE